MRGTRVRPSKTYLSRRLGLIKGILSGVLVRVTKYKDVDEEYVIDRLKATLKEVDHLLEVVHNADKTRES